MDAARCAYNDRLVATRDYLADYDVTLYCDIFYAFGKVQKMSSYESKQFYPWLLHPVFDSYKIDSASASQLTHKIITSCRMNLLEQITDLLEDEMNLEYPNPDWEQPENV